MEFQGKEEARTRNTMLVSASFSVIEDVKQPQASVL
jgi:hypothetical protein